MSEGRSTFRYTVGMNAILGGLAGLLCLYWVEIPGGNRDAVMLALGIVLGWGSSVINGEWGSSPAGRAAAEAGAEAARKQLDSPSGTPGDPLAVQGAPAGSKPVTVKETK